MCICIYLEGRVDRWFYLCYLCMSGKRRVNWGIGISILSIRRPRLRDTLTLRGDGRTLYWSIASSPCCGVNTRGAKKIDGIFKVFGTRGAALIMPLTQCFSGAETLLCYYLLPKRDHVDIHSCIQKKVIGRDIHRNTWLNQREHETPHGTMLRTISITVSAKKRKAIFSPIVYLITCPEGLSNIRLL